MDKTNRYVARNTIKREQIHIFWRLHRLNYVIRCDRNAAGRAQKRATQVSMLCSFLPLSSKQAGAVTSSKQIDKIE